MARIVRPATAVDEPFLRDMLLAAIFVPDGDAPFPPDIVRTEPELAALVDGFGTAAGDHGAIADEDGRPVGAAWVRLVPGGYGHVADDVPELSIAVVADRRGDGIGGELLSALLCEVEPIVPGVSLSCDARNRAMSLYERFGFEQVRNDPPHSVVMVRRSASTRPR